MNKKGMTLVELIAVIAILGILAVISSPAVMKIRNTVLQNTLDSKISMIKSAAIEYGFDNLNSIPNRVDAYNPDGSATDKNNFENEIPCICDCTTTPVHGKGCADVCNFSSVEDDSEGITSVSDGAFALTSKSSSSVCTNHCLTVKIGTLIEMGYLVGDKDDKNTLANPCSETPLNFSEVCIRFNNNSAKNRKIITYIIGEGNLCNETK